MKIFRIAQGGGIRVNLLWLVVLSNVLGAVADASVTWGGGGANALASNPTNWVGGIAPVAGDVITLDTNSHKNMTWNMTNMTVQSWTQVGYTGTVTIATVFGATGFTNFSISGDCIISNGVWTHATNSNGETNRLRISVGGAFVVGSNAVIDANGKGYAATYGPGRGLRGASYGGRGGSYSSSIASGPCYGSAVLPVNLGSGGSDVAGGGALWLTVGGELRLEGTIRANGTTGTGSDSCGSGGSIYVVAGALRGSGGITANGGANGWESGGGGRIALVVTNAGADYSNFTGSLSAFTGSGTYKGIAGTIYRETADTVGRGELIVNNLSGSALYGGGTELGNSTMTCEFSRITLTNAGVLVVGTNATVVMTNNVLSAGTLSCGIWVTGGTLMVPPAFAYSNLFIGITSTGSVLRPATSLTIGTNAEFRANVPYALTNDITILAGGNLTHTANGSTEAYKINLTINGAVTIMTNGSVNVTAKGYAASTGPGAGGSYGGHGWGGLCYGSLIAPTNLGSGADDMGGGAIRLTVSGAIQNDGLICADGGSGGNSGAGGSIYLTSGSLKGNGTIRARGVNNSSYASGGGRIALVVTDPGADFSLYTGGVLASYGTAYSGAGTLYLRTAAQGLNEGTLIVDNAGVATSDYTEISSNVIDTMVGNVVVRNGGTLQLQTNQNLTVGGVWSNAATFSAQWGSQVILGGGAASTGTLYGTTTFMGLTCTNVGKTILFQAGKTNAIAAQGRLTLKGVDTTNLTLRSTTEGTKWKLNVNGAAEQVIEKVDVKDSDAMTGVGAEVTAMNSVDSGSNLNWRFITVASGETNAWTGASNTVWSWSTNWSLGRAPIEDDVIIIPGGKSRYPVLDASRVVNAITIQAGGMLSLGGYNLAVKQLAAIAGSLVATAGESITFQSDVDFTGGTFTPVRSTVVLTGSVDQVVNFAGLTFFKVLVLNNAATVNFAAGFSATEFRSEMPVGAGNLTFLQGGTVAVRDLILLGAAGSTNMILQSSSPGSLWNLVVTGYRNVRGVEVQDSDAHSGLPIPAAASQDDGNNQNWLFGAGPSVWVGASNNNFHTAANWAPTGVPDGTVRVLVNGTVPMSITGAVTVLDLTVGGGAAISTGTVGAALTVLENITVLSNGTLILNKPCVVSNGLYVLGGGLLTHSANWATEANKLNVTANGNVEISENGCVDVTAKGYAAGNGPGYAGSYGGHGWGGQCYGSIMAPTNLGSGADDAGGGAIRLLAGGTIRNDGILRADGGSSGDSGSGGSIFLTSGSLCGVGTIQARGVSGGTYASGGGRIALVVTNAGADFSQYSGVVVASLGVTEAGAGTIYKQMASDLPNRGTVWINNLGVACSDFTEVPSYTNAVAGESERAVFIITNGASLRLKNDYNVGDIFLSSANTVLDLGSRVLVVHARQHTLSGTVINFGSIVWMPDVAGTIFSIR